MGLTVLETAAIYAGRSKDQTLIVETATVIMHFLKEGKYDEQLRGVQALGNAAPGMADLPLAAELYEQAIAVISTVEQPELVEAGLEALRRVFKFCRHQNPETYIAKTFEFVSAFVGGSITLLQGTPVADTPFGSSLLQSLMEFLGDLFAAAPVGIDGICEYLLCWLASATQSDQYAILGALTDAIEYCAVDDHTLSRLLQWLTEAVPRLTEPDSQHNSAYLLSLLLRKYPQYREHAAAFLPIITEWWNFGLGKKSGYEDLLANCVSFFLAYACVNPAGIEEELLIRALAKFPPADMGESATACELLLSILKSGGISGEFQAAIAEGVARLLTEPEGKRAKRKISEELMDEVREAFRGIMARVDIHGEILSEFQNKRSKLAEILAILEN
jgi:hypothetical protein